MIVKLVLLFVLGLAPAFGCSLADSLAFGGNSAFDGNWRDMEWIFLGNIKEKEVLKKKDLDFCKKFASVLISGLKLAIPEHNRVFDEEYEQKVSSSAYDSDDDDYSSESEKLSGLIGLLSYDLAMVKKTLPDKYHGAISAIHDASEEDLCDACDNALAGLSQ
jgi:hypothetical protein